MQEALAGNLLLGRPGDYSDCLTGQTFEPRLGSTLQLGFCMITWLLVLDYLIAVS